MTTLLPTLAACDGASAGKPDTVGTADTGTLPDDGALARAASGYVPRSRPRCCGRAPRAVGPTTPVPPSRA